MSKHTEVLDVPMTVAACYAACERAASAPEWRIIDRQQTAIKCTETTSDAFNFTNPATLEVSLTERSGGSGICIAATNIGFGPLQSRHVRNQAQRLRSSIETELRRPAAKPTAEGDLQDGGVIVNGVRLSAEQRQDIEQRHHVKLADGRYWYDSVCGAWGLEGQPQAGVAAAGVAIGGPLRADASNGTSGVIINGRELHTLDVQRLSALIGPVLPGRWWVDAQGNFGPEGWPMIGNLFQLARARAGGGGDGASSEVISKSGASLTSDGQGGLHFMGSIGSGIGAWNT